MIKIFRTIQEILLPKDQKKIWLIFFMLITMSIIEITSAASIMPFILVVSDSTIINNNRYLYFFYEFFNFNSKHHFILILGSCVFGLVIIGNSFRAFTQYTIAKFVHRQTHTISSRILKIYFSKPYYWFLDKDISKIESTILIESTNFSLQILWPALQLIANLTVSVFFILLLISLNPFIAFFTVFILGGTYFFLYRFLRKKRSILGKKRIKAQADSYKILKESLGGIKEVKVFGLERSQHEKFSKQSSQISEMNAKIKITSEIPGYIFQALSFGSIIAIILILKIFKDQEIKDIIPLIAVYAFAGLRLTPAFQKIYSNLTTLNAEHTIINLIYEVLISKRNEETINSFENAKENLVLRNHIIFNQVFFKYNSSDTLIFENLNLTLKANTQIGIMGATGSGKTTFLDILLGLLTPQSGTITVDNTIITQDNIRKWQNTIGYVPQTVFLLDDTIATNIAFGDPNSEVDYKKIELAARAAALEEFIIKDLPNGYETKIGEKGVRLSGGQRQRLGIARALYRNPSVLILDEATNALDKITEESILNNLNKLVGNITILIVSHHIDTLKNCDEIFELEQGYIRKINNLKPVH